MLRPFDPGDCNTACHRFDTQKQMKISNDRKLRKIKMKKASGFEITWFILTLLIFVTPTFVLEPHGGSATSPSRYGAGWKLTRWPSCRAGRPRERGGRANEVGELAVGPVALTPDPRSAVRGGQEIKRQLQQRTWGWKRERVGKPRPGPRSPSTSGPGTESISPVADPGSKQTSPIRT